METTKINRLAIVLVLGLTATLALLIALNASIVSAQGCDYRANVLADTPIAYWRLGEISVLTASNIGSLGGAVDGTYTNGVSQGAPGLILSDPDLAASFDGSDDFVSIPDDGGINTGGPYTTKTVELWFSANGPLPESGTRQVLYEQGGINNGLNVFLDGNLLYVGAWANYQTATPAGVWVSTTTPITPNTAYHVVLVYDGSTQSVSGYLNGSLFGSQPNLSGDLTSIPGHVGDIAFGGVDDETRYSPTDGIGGSGSGDYFNGTVDEVALYDYILPPDRIQFHAQDCGASGPAIAVAKTGPATAGVGDAAIYTFTVSNIGDSPFQGLQVEDDVAGTGTYVSGDDGNGVLDLTESWIYTASYTIGLDDPDPLVNTVVVTATDPPDTEVSDSDTHSLDIQTCYEKKVSDDNPIAYWRLGETSGTTAVNIGSLIDVNGTYTNGVSLGLPGLILGDPDLAAGFVGATEGADDMVGIPDNAAINTGGPYSEKTIELWFRANDVAARQVLYEQGGDIRGLNVYIEGNNLYLNGWNTPTDGPGSPWGPSFITATVSAGTTYHVVLVFEGDLGLAGTITGYLDGASLGTATGIGLLYAHADDIGIGGENGLSNYHDGLSGTTDAFPFNGVIDEVALYDYALPSTRILVHAGDCLVTVPDVVGLPQAQAEANIGAAGLAVGDVAQQHSDSVPAGNVISQDPTAGSSVAPGSPVDPVISLGPAPVTVPDVVGLSGAQAQTDIEAAGLTVGDVTEQYSDSVPADNVISQDPAAGSSVAPGSPVNLVVSLGLVLDLSLSKTVDDASPVPGQAITYTVSVHNSGTTGASGVVISDTLSASVTFVTSNTTNGSSYDANTGVWDVGNVGASTGVTLTLVVTANAVSGQSITNTAVLSASTPPDPDSRNNASSAAVTMGGGRQFIYLPLIVKNTVH